LVRKVGESEIDDEVSLEYYRAGDMKQVNVKLAKNERRPGIRWHSQIPDPESFKMKGGAWLGVKTENLSDQLREYFDVPDNLGVLIKEVVEESPAYSAGLKAGDVIIGVADRDIKNTHDLSRTINYYNPEEEVDIVLIREKSKLNVTVKLGESDFPRRMHFYGFDGDQIDIPDIDVEIELDELRELKDNLHDGNRIKIKPIKKLISEV
jgi:predicted metalloprotease with PDZ domain